AQSAITNGETHLSQCCLGLTYTAPRFSRLNAAGFRNRFRRGGTFGSDLRERLRRQSLYELLFLFYFRIFDSSGCRRVLIRGWYVLLLGFFSGTFGFLGDGTR